MTTLPEESPESDLIRTGQENDRFNAVIDALAVLHVQVGIWANDPATSLPWDGLREDLGHAVGRALAAEDLTTDDVFLTSFYDRASEAAIRRVGQASR